MAGAFILTLAFSSWHEGLWRSDAAPVTRAAPQPHEDRLAPTVAVGSRPSGPSAPAMATPTAAAAPAAAAMEPAQSEPDSTSDVDHGEMRARSDRSAERGARTH
jgi:hypothetical protein